MISLRRLNRLWCVRVVACSVMTLLPGISLYALPVIPDIEGTCAGLDLPCFPTAPADAFSVDHTLLPIPDAVQDHLLALPDEHEPSAAWIARNHPLVRAFEEHHAPQNALNPMFGYNITLLSETMERIFALHIQLPDFSRILVLQMKPGFKLTKQALNKLRTAGISEQIANTLASLENREFSAKADFLQEIEQQIGKDPTARYEVLLLEHASFDMPVSEIGSVKPATEIALLDMSADYRKNLEAWDPVLYYSRLFRKAIGQDGYNKPRARSAVPPEDDLIFDVVQFFKKWGIPTPLTVLLGILVLYVLLVFLSWILSRGKQSG